MNPVAEILDGLAKERGYKDASAFMKGQCLVAIQNERRKTWIREIANAKPTVQDYVIEKMLAWPLDLKGMIAMLREIDKNNKQSKK